MTKKKGGLPHLKTTDIIANPGDIVPWKYLGVNLCAVDSEQWSVVCDLWFGWMGQFFGLEKAVLAKGLDKFGSDWLLGK
jgi:hypothetical protein